MQIPNAPVAPAIDKNSSTARRHKLLDVSSGGNPEQPANYVRTPPSFASSIGGSSLRLCVSPETHAFNRVGACPSSCANRGRTMRSGNPRRLLTPCDATAGLRQSAHVSVAPAICAILDTFLADAAVRLHPETPCFADFEADDAGIERDEPADQLVRPVLRSAPLASRVAGHLLISGCR